MIGKNKFINIVIFVPALVLMCLIFYFSSQLGDESANTSSQTSYEIVDTKYELMNIDIAEWQKWKEASEINMYVRKAAHMSEYALLAILILVPLTYLFRLCIDIKTLSFMTFLICTTYAIADEIHQYFIPGRTSAPLDVCIDSIGSMLGLCAALLIYKAFQNKNKKLLKRKDES